MPGKGAARIRHHSTEDVVRVEAASLRPNHPSQIESQRALIVTLNEDGQSERADGLLRALN